MKIANSHRHHNRSARLSKSHWKNAKRGLGFVFGIEFGIGIGHLLARKDIPSLLRSLVRGKL